MRAFEGRNFDFEGVVVSMFVLGLSGRVRDGGGEGVGRSFTEHFDTEKDACAEQNGNAGDQADHEGFGIFFRCVG